VKPVVDPQKIYAITRPDPSLLTLYILRWILFPIALIPAIIRYYTLQYRFDDEGIHRSVGWFFRREDVIRYARIQDLHISRGLLQRWLGLATVEIQTAAGSSSAEMTLEGMKEFEEIRDFLYSKMRGARFGEEPQPHAKEAPDDVVALLTEIRDELRRVRGA
jgi:putative membrane protein